MHLIEIDSNPYNETDLDKAEYTIDGLLLEEHKALQSYFEKFGNPIINDEDYGNEVEVEIHELEWKSLQGDCIGKESEDECASSFFFGDLQIIAKDVGSCEGGETYFVSERKEDYRSDLQSPLEPHNE